MMRDREPDGRPAASPSPDGTGSGLAPLRLLMAGVGGYGCRVMRDLVTAFPEQRHLLAMHTHAQQLAAAGTPQRILIGSRSAAAIGSGGDVAFGRRAAEEDIVLLREWLRGGDLLMLCAGLGGGTGTGAAPVLARLAAEEDIPVLAFVTLPFPFEGRDRRRNAEEGLDLLRSLCGGAVALDNRRLLTAPPEEDASVARCFEQAITVMVRWVTALHALLTEEGLIQLDFGDVRALLRGGNVSAMAYAEAAGPEAAALAARQLLEDPLLERGALIERARHGLLGLVSGPDLRLADMASAMDAVTSRAPETASWNTGVTITESWKGRVGMTVMAGSLPETARESSSAPIAAAGPRRRRGEQSSLRLDTSGRGRFKDVAPTIHQGEDLDYPTFFRRKMRLVRD